MSSYSRSASTRLRLLVGSSNTMIRAPATNRGGDLHELLLRCRQPANRACASRRRRRPRRAWRPRAIPSLPGSRSRASPAAHRGTGSPRRTGCRRTRAPGAPCRRRPARASRGLPKCTSLPVKQHASLVRHVDAGEDLSERALAGSVFAAKRVADSGRDLQRHVAQRLDAGKRFEIDSNRTAAVTRLALRASGSAQARR